MADAARKVDSAATRTMATRRGGAAQLRTDRRADRQPGITTEPP
jgi:hypothetical protein